MLSTLPCWRLLHRGCDWFGDTAVGRLSRPFEVVTHQRSDRPVLTFDDGPDPESTPRLLDTLAAAGTTATWFVVGERAARHPDLIRKITAAGHTVGNHSWSHAMPWRLSPRDQWREYARTQRLIEDLIGSACDRVRPPYGMHTPAMAQWARRHRAEVWMWSRMPADYRAGCDDRRVAGMLARARAGEIVCLHENAAARHRTPAIVAQWLSQWLSQIDRRRTEKPVHLMDGLCERSPLTRAHGEAPHDPSGQPGESGESGALPNVCVPKVGAKPELTLPPAHASHVGTNRHVS